MSVLTWVEKSVDGEGLAKYREATIGNYEGGDGVRFTLDYRPTCYRRGPWWLLIEVALGQSHHKWGCFDAADQPERRGASASQRPMIRALLHRLVKRLRAPRVIYDRAGESPYLSRWYLLDRWRTGEGVSVFLHCFHRGDDDVELHNHPWTWSAALILSGGYREERRVGDEVIVREVRPGSINVIRGDDFHRVDLYDDEAWSLFIAGPQTGKSWGFWNRLTREFLPWREFITRKRGPGWEAT